MIDTSKVTRRKLKFESIADLETELGRIEQAYREGRLRHTGNWSPGTIMAHLAAWLAYGWVGYPRAAHVPWFIRPLLKMKRNKFFRTDLPGGFRIPGIEAGTLANEPAEFDEGMKRLREALEPLKRGEAPPHPSPAFGRLNHREATILLLKHAELHLGYLEY